MKSTREAFGEALVRLGSIYPEMLVLDGDVKNSTYTNLFENKYPDRFIECYIAEQNMVGVALGIAKIGFLPWVSSFSVFLSRAADQIRMAALSGVTIRYCGSHAGVSIGADGPSQMGLSDIAQFRGITGSTVLSPSDPYQTDKLVEAMMKIDGTSYIRTMRDAMPDIYTQSDTFSIGGAKMFDVPDATVTVVATGVTVHEALKAQKMLPNLRVIDCYSIKPIDEGSLKKAASETKGIIVVEDHYPEGGLGDAVRSTLANSSKIPIIHLAVRKTPRSGKPDELLAYEEINTDAIIKEARKL